MSHLFRYVCIGITLFAVTGCSLLGLEMVTGSGVSLTEERDVGSFREVELSGAINATIHPAEVCAVTVEGDDNLVPLIITEVEGDRLRVRSKSRINMRPKLPLKVTIACPTLSSLEVSGACDVAVDDLQAERFGLQVSGASEVDVTGACDTLNVDVSGASAVDLGSLTATTIQLEVSGASELEVHATDSISGGASGASSVAHSGSSNVQIETSGVSSVEAIEP